ncbi:MAG: hypothetical protein OER04_08510 [Cyclobacteriaceae bacterium]|nr:hypothetical protein [Cyclobacteriaceae bacterium]
MKTSKVYHSLLAMFFLCLTAWFTTGCEDHLYNGIESADPATQQDDWVALLEEINAESSIIVEKESSIQDAVDAANPGDAIYIEPGTYPESVTITKSNIQLIGLKGESGEQVSISGLKGMDKVGVEIRNIQHPELMTKGPNNNHKRSDKKRRLISMDRRELKNGIAHYRFVVDLGKDEFDVVRIHRVVREHRSYRPVRTDGAVFMIHGSSQNFDDIFLRPGVDKPDEQSSSPLYLASNNIDVWGIDLAWTLVPLETSDFSFMKDWGVERDVDHTLKAMAIARLVRGLSGQGFDQLNLLGFSYGVAVAYAAAGRETQQHGIRRDIKGVIAAEGAMKYAVEDEDSRIANCNRAAGAQAQLDMGIYQNSNGLTFSLFGDDAVLSPHDPSPVPGFTNYQFVLFLGTSTFAQGDPPAPFWHFVGGEFDGTSPIPQGLLYTKPSRWIQLLRGLPPYQPQLGGKELSACLCNEEEVTIDDHLSEIKLPILYLGVAGGFGQQGLFTSSLTRSSDVTDYIVTLQPGELRAIDFGHGDLFMAEEASELAWEVLRRWLVEHAQKFRA